MLALISHCSEVRHFTLSPFVSDYWFPNDRIQLQATCVNGGWVPDPIAAACTPVTCPDPGLPPTVRADLVKPANLSTFTPTTSPTGRIFYGEG